MKKLAKMTNLHNETVEAYNMSTFANGSCSCDCTCYGTFEAFLNTGIGNSLDLYS